MSIEKTEKITSFTDLIAYKKSHQLVLDVYLLTKKFPADERFALIDQIKRSVTSATSNIAEGFSRNSAKEKIQFYSITKGSLTELHSQMLIAKDLLYITPSDLLAIESNIIECIKLVSGLSKSAMNR